MWLCEPVPRSTSLSPDYRRRLFMNMLRQESIGKELASHLVRMVFEERPWMAGSALAQRSRMLDKFFRGVCRNGFQILMLGADQTTKRVPRHCRNFLSLTVLFVGRLEGKGIHGQSPAMAATKPHYFLELDILRTFENFIEYVPEFWSSSEFAQYFASTLSTSSSCL